jgi:dipeptidyl aminopeptidase/acylaminoacyl peptidase
MDTRKYIKFVCGAIAGFICGLVPCPLLGQVLPKKQLTQDDYHLWGTLQTQAMSADGSWVSYKISYESGLDTLFLKNTRTKALHAFPKGIDGRFDGGTFAYRAAGSLILFDLAKEKERRIPDVMQYDFVGNGSYLVTLNNSNGKMLCITNRSSEPVECIKDVTGYSLNNAKDMVVFTTSSEGHTSVGLVKLKGHYSHWEIAAGAAEFTLPVWQPNGDAFSFLSTDESTPTLYYYNTPFNKLHRLQADMQDFPVQMRIAMNYEWPLRISRDGSKVFFGMETTVAKKEVLSTNPEIWNGNDKLLYPDRKLMASIVYPQFLGVWFPETSVVRQITTEKRSQVMLTGDERHAIISDPYEYEPEYKLECDRDYYLVNLYTGTEKLLLKKESGQMSYINISPDGRYVNYYRDSDWWVYDIVKESHTNITKGIDAQWDNTASDPGTYIIVWDCPGWSSDGKYVLLNEYHDIWAVSADGTEKRRLTHGKEMDRRMRFKEIEGSASYNNYSGCFATKYDLSKLQILTFADMSKGTFGYYSLMPQKAPVPYASGDCKIGRLVRSANGKTAVYEKETYAVSPQIIVKHAGKPAKVLVETNTHQKNYAWGHAEMIHYKGIRDSILHGVLIYPQAYDAKKKYPMVTYLYERVSHRLNDYVNPSNENGIGINATNLSAKGYFVLLADMNYEVGNPGVSAAYCVTAAVNKVLEKVSVDPTKLGLLGQSFSGYETNCIVTNTKMFAAAVTGNSVADNVMQYFNVHENLRNVDAWRYENQQFRMHTPFYENQKGYFRNSPLLNASNITTPMLIWAGGSDNNVQPQQSRALYVALRRLNKKSIMLVYPKEGHILNDGVDMADLTIRAEEWFGHFLKGEKCKWIEEGTN